MRRLNIGFDIDGVLANFSYRYMDLHLEMSGRDLFPPYARNRALYPDTWYFATDAGYTPEEDKAVWGYIANPTTLFWQTLPSLVDDSVFDRIRALEKIANVSFITDRPASNALEQTQYWLSKQGVLRPNVVISKNKMEVAKELALDFYLDDKPSNFDGIQNIIPTLKGYLLNTAYNRPITVVPEVMRIDRVQEFLLVVETSACLAMQG